MCSYVALLMRQQGQRIKRQEIRESLHQEIKQVIGNGQKRRNAWRATKNHRYISRQGTKEKLSRQDRLRYRSKRDFPRINHTKKEEFRSHIRSRSKRSGKSPRLDCPPAETGVLSYPVRFTNYTPPTREIRTWKEILHQISNGSHPGLPVFSCTEGLNQTQVGHECCPIGGARSNPARAAARGGSGIKSKGSSRPGGIGIRSPI